MSKLGAWVDAALVAGKSMQYNANQCYVMQYYIIMQIDAKYCQSRMHKSDPFWQVQPWRKEQKRAKAKVLR